MTSMVKSLRTILSLSGKPVFFLQQGDARGSVASALSRNWKGPLFLHWHPLIPNFTQAINWRDIFEELAGLGIPTDFNQGMDARLIDDERAELISRVNMPMIRMAFDYRGIRPWVERAIMKLREHGVRGRRMVFYVLHNYVDDPEDFFERVRDLLDWGAVVYPMRYEPLTTLRKGVYVSPRWTREQLSAVAQARRVLGYGGALPPYKPLVEKFLRARNFDEAFSLRPVGGNWRITDPVIEMALEHEQQESINKNYFPSWRREKDWRKTPQLISSPGR